MLNLSHVAISLVQNHFVWFVRLHDRKICVLGLCSLMSTGANRPQEINEVATQMIPSLLHLFQGLKRAYASKYTVLSLVAPFSLTHTAAFRQWKSRQGNTYTAPSVTMMCWWYTDYVVLLYTNSLMCCCTVTDWCVVAHWLTMKYCCTLTDWCVVVHWPTDVLLHTHWLMCCCTHWLMCR